MISACAQTPPQPVAPSTITVCDEQGCAERPRDFETFRPQRTAEEEAAVQQIAALEVIAKKDPSAAYDLALRLFRGDGVKQDLYRSVQWMRDAAERGHFDAQKALGRLYLTGLAEMGSDPMEAQKWLTITAGRGDKEAEKLLEEANAAKQELEDDYRWRQRWRQTFYNYWAHSYPYYWRWGAGRWYYSYH